MALSPKRAVLLSVSLALLAFTAGCAGLLPGGQSPETTTTADGTTTAGTTSTQATVTTASPTDTTTRTSTTTEVVATGSMTVLIGDTPVDLSASGGPVTFDDWGQRTWASRSTDVTVAGALAATGVDLGVDTLTYNGTTYDDTEADTSVEVRVDGEPVDPTTYTLENDDRVWIYVSSPAATVTPPGTYISEDHAHMHGEIDVVVDGDPLDLSDERFQHRNEFFHLEDGNGDIFHAHTYSGTYGFALGTLGINVSEESVTYEGMTYDRTGENSSVQLLVNGDPVESMDYRLKDGDAIRVVLNSST